MKAKHQRRCPFYKHPLWCPFLVFQPRSRGLDHFRPISYYLLVFACIFYTVFSFWTVVGSPPLFLFQDRPLSLTFGSGVGKILPCNPFPYLFRKKNKRRYKCNCLKIKSIKEKKIKFFQHLFIPQNFYHSFPSKETTEGKKAPSQNYIIITL